VRNCNCALAILLTTLATHSANAYPDGAPWGAANPAADENCATCHFDHEAMQHSKAIRIGGLPERPAPGSEYELELEFLDPAAISVGFQLIVQAPDEHSGTLSSLAAGVEFIGAAIRSIAPLRNDTGVSWTLTWHTPVEIKLPIRIYVAASSTNDDESPFGDTIHFREFVIRNVSTEVQ
jgi:hypothetical protein